MLLSTGPKDCSGTTPWAAVVLERSGLFWHARGEWLGTELSNSSMADARGQPETKDLKIALGARGTSDDGPTIELQLSGSGEIGDYPVNLEGTIEAIDCPTD